MGNVECTQWRVRWFVVGGRSLNNLDEMSTVEAEHAKVSVRRETVSGCAWREGRVKSTCCNVFAVTTL